MRLTDDNETMAESFARHAIYFAQESVLAYKRGDHETARVMAKHSSNARRALTGVKSALAGAAGCVVE
jgi:hypothetical protein